VAESLPGPGNRALRMAGLLAIGGVPTLVVVTVLGAVGVAFTVAGLALFVAGKAGIAEALPPWVSMDADPRLALIVGVVLFVVGGMCLLGLWLYLRLATHIVERVLPTRTA
jgi:hypothetical protein